MTSIKWKGSLTKADLDAWRAEHSANQQRLAGCPRHRFDVHPVKLGEKLKCLDCAGTIGLVELGYYIAGYEAGGGSADDIWPGYHGATQ